MTAVVEALRSHLRDSVLRREVADDLSDRDLRELRQTLSATAAGDGGETSARRRADWLATTYLRLSSAERRRYLRVIASEFDLDRGVVSNVARSLLDAVDAGTCTAARAGARAALRPPQVDVLRQFNLLAGGTKFLVDLRAELLTFARDEETLMPLAHDLKDLLASWFDPGFLQLRPITWDSPASLLEQLAESEAVHKVAGWDDLKSRLNQHDRRVFAFFHPHMHNEPLIFVHVALTRGLAAKVGDLLDPARPLDTGEDADTAIFYSISSVQRGLDGISLGGSLIKRVVDELSTDLPKLKQFATLSPIPGFRTWLDGRAVAETVTLIQQCARYLIHAKRPNQSVVDPVAHFHLSNGARIERLNVDADGSTQGVASSYGLMATYRYRLDDIERNRSAYVNERKIPASPAITRLAR